ncbi:ATP-grasp domain-containing protein [Cytobacillus firmus]|uniref:ATP-grasp domain-containing protein n=1 Tax=Cytobacillus firmus TaxID=1399 RepID=A0A800MXJ9_CYTFI|nr:ATP-grasp domain-containing protein [Cytobacillus firmus]KAF0824284.1 hypothetical protein KIS1582_1963 [Cytobacillus firmus]
MGNILMVGSGGGATKGAVFKTILKCGHKITLIDKGNSPFNRLVDYLIFSDPFNTDNFQTVFEKVKEVDKIDKISAILPMSDLTVELASLLNEKLGLKGLNSQISLITRNKARLREKMSKFNLNIPRFFEGDKHSLALAKKFGQEIGYPLVIKPVDSAGSMGVYRCENEQELEFFFGTIFKSVNTNHIIVEEFIEGPEISVETISQNGNIIFMSLTEKVKMDDVNFVEAGHITPCDIAVEQVEVVRNEVKRLLNIVGLRDGISHTELKLTSNGPYIIEMGSRAAGAYLPDLIELAYGVNPFELWIQSLTSQETIEIKYWEKQYASVHFFYPSKGEIESIPTPNHLDTATLESIVDFGSYCKVGDTFDREITSNFDRIGHIIVTAPTKEDLLCRITSTSDKLSPRFFKKEVQV